MYLYKQKNNNKNDKQQGDLAVKKANGEICGRTRTFKALKRLQNKDCAMGFKYS